MKIRMTVTTPELGVVSTMYRSATQAAQAAATQCAAWGAGQYSTNPAMWRVSRKTPRLGFGNANRTHFVELNLEN